MNITDIKNRLDDMANSLTKCASELDRYRDNIADLEKVLDSAAKKSATVTVSQVGGQWIVNMKIGVQQFNLYPNETKQTAKVKANLLRQALEIGK